jgi:hypothetical protein
MRGSGSVLKFHGSGTLSRKMFTLLQTCLEIKIAKKDRYKIDCMNNMNLKILKFFSEAASSLAASSEALYPALSS